MKNLTIIIVLLCSFSFLQAQQIAKPNGNTINFINSSAASNGGGGQLGHVVIAPFNDVQSGNSQWISMGNSNSGNSFYGMRIQKKANFATFSVNTSGSSENLDVLWGGLNSDFNFKYATNATSAATNLMTIKSTGNVGIGTTNPTAGLSVKNDDGINVQSVTNVSAKGTIKMADGFTNTTSRDDMLFSTSGGFMFKMDDNSNGISNVQGFNVYNRNNHSVFAIKETTGNVGIGTTNPTEKLDVDGNIKTNVSFINSDRRYKNEIETLPNPLELLNSINGSSYVYNKEKFPYKNFKTGKSIGFIAQDFETYLPELLTKDDKGFYAVNYDGVIPILVEAVKELEVDLDNKDKKIETDAIKIQQLEEEIEALKAVVQQLVADQGQVSNKKTTLSTRGSLSQNTPNPFGASTTINYLLADDVKNAAIIVYDLQGKELKRFENLSTGENSLMISSDLQNGTYIYSLIVDGELVDTKRMIASK